jgi:hypothetical protein
MQMTFATGARRAAALGAALIGALAGVPSSARADSVSQVRTVYRAVLSAEYFGPASGVCSRLTPTGRASFAPDRGGTCTQAFASEQHVLRHKVPGVDDSGYTPAQWRAVVDGALAGLKVTVSGSRASAVGPYGIPGRTRLVRVGGRWLFDTYPPSIEP